MSNHKKRIDPKLKVLKMSDRAESYRIKKKRTFDLPMRVLIVGKSQYAGKTNFVGNMLLRPYGDDDEYDPDGDFYRRDFTGDNIYIICPSTDIDSKWRTIIEELDIPSGNVYTSYDEEQLERLYENLSADCTRRLNAGAKPEQTLVIMDDCSWSGDLKSKLHGVISKFACNGRQFFISLIVTSQKYTDIATTLRENATGMVLFGCSHKQAELIYNDVGDRDKKEFLRMFYDTTREPHSFMVVNYSKPADMRFMDVNFEPIT